MRIPLAFLVILAAASPLLAQSQVVETKYPGGQVRERFTVGEGGLSSGPFTLYSEDGKVKAKGQYKADQLDGPYQGLYPDGKVHIRCTYLKNQLEGAWSELDPKGRKIRTAEYRQGRLNGIVRDYKDDVLVSERGYVDGQLIYPRSIAMIGAELARIRKLPIPTAGAADKAKPDAIPAHKGGNDSPADRENAVRLLMEYRYLCGVPYENLALDPLSCAHDEAATAILADIGKLDHNPPNPGWPDADYQFAKLGCGRSNLFQGRGGSVAAVRAFMDDSDSSNIDRIGHRRWSLNPPMGKVGFAASRGFAAMWCFDTSRQSIPAWDYIAYPAPGFFPDSHFGTSYAWSISLNEQKYRKPDKDSVKVTVKPARINLAQGKIETGPEMRLNYFNVDLGGFAVPNCIIFRPEGLATRPGAGTVGGAYQVEVTGLRARNGDEATLRYLVEFVPGSPFPAAAPDRPTTPRWSGRPNR